MKTCDQCGTPVAPWPVNARYCSKACRYEHHNEQRRGQYEQRVCAFCKAAFRCAASKAQRYCGQACQAAGSPEPQRWARVCPECDAAFEASTKARKYCSVACRRNINSRMAIAAQREARRELAKAPTSDEAVLKRAARLEEVRAAIDAARMELSREREAIVIERRAARSEAEAQARRLEQERELVTAERERLAAERRAFERQRAVHQISGQVGRCRECGGSLWASPTASGTVLVTCMSCAREREVNVFGRPLSTAPLERVHPARLT